MSNAMKIRKSFSGQTQQLKDLCISITDCHHSTPVWSDAGKIVIRNFNIKNGKLDLSSPFFTDDDTFNERIARAKPEAGDLIITREAPMGEVCVIPKGVECCLGQRMVLIKPDPSKVTSQYLLYAMLSSFVQAQINKSDKTGSIVSNLRIPLLKELEIPVIEGSEKIAFVLSTLDAKIECNNRINEELEAITKTIYDYWFLQFDFPNVDGQPYKSSGGKMTYNSVLNREIPNGWIVKKIEDHADVKKGDLITAKDAIAGPYKVVAAGVDYSYSHSEFNRTVNTITISGSGANAGFINFWREPIFASDCITVKGKTDCETLLLLQYLRFIQPHILNQATGSAQPHVYPSDIKTLDYVVADSQLIERFGEIAIPINEQIRKNINENVQLIELRDWLLPLLMNGQVTVV